MRHLTDRQEKDCVHLMGPCHGIWFAKNLRGVRLRLHGCCEAFSGSAEGRHGSGRANRLNQAVHRSLGTHSNRGAMMDKNTLSSDRVKYSLAGGSMHWCDICCVIRSSQGARHRRRSEDRTFRLCSTSFGTTATQETATTAPLVVPNSTTSSNYLVNFPNH